MNSSPLLSEWLRASCTYKVDKAMICPCEGVFCAKGADLLVGRVEVQQSRQSLQSALQMPVNMPSADPLKHDIAPSACYMKESSFDATSDVATNLKRHGRNEAAQKLQLLSIWLDVKRDPSDTWRRVAQRTPPRIA